MEKNPDIGILGCKLIMPGNILHENCSAFPWLILVLENPLYIFSLPKWIFRRIKFSFWDYNDIKDVDWLLGACLMIRKEVFDKIGLWDDRFFLYAEDLEFCYRAAKNKTRIIYFPGATVMHCHNVSGRQIFGDKKRLMEYVSMQKFLEKYTGRKGLVFGFATQIVSISVKILLCVLTIVFCPRKRRSVIGYLRLWLFTLLGIAKSGWNAEYQKG
jgi:GT2 family glycosyltransferase